MNVRSISEIGIEPVDARRFETLPEKHLGCGTDTRPCDCNKPLAVFVSLLGSILCIQR
jgi:hypothetical protein